MEESWQYWEKQGFLENDQYGCRTKKEEQQQLLAKYGKSFHDPECFCRPVDIKDFTDHSEYNAGEIMAGFHGEYWHLNGDLNPFDESMHAIARVQSLLGGDGVTIDID